MTDNNRNTKPAMSEKLMRSFGRVQGRKLSQQQEWFVDNVLPKVAVDVQSDVDLNSLFDNKYNKFCIEIGFGKGEHLARYAKKNEDFGFIGCEPFINGVSRLLKYLHEEDVCNVRVLHGDARLLLDELGDSSIDKIFILFPDPWPKAKHHKKRIISKEMLTLICRVLKKGGVLEVATDHVEYGQWIAEHLEEFDGLVKDRVSEIPPDDWVRTNYQAKAEKQGRGATFFRYLNIVEK